MSTLANVVDVTVSGRVETTPADLFSNPPSVSWLVAHCKPRQEKRLCCDLRRLGVNCGLFLERRLRRYPGKGVQESSVPLLGGYVFCVGSWAERDMIYSTERVVHVLSVPNPRLLAMELRLLNDLIHRSEESLIVKPEIEPGRLVFITVGTFAGLTGVVARRDGIDMLVVNLSVLGTSVGVRLPAMTAALA